MSHPNQPPKYHSTRIIIEAVPPEKMRLPAYQEEGFGDWFVNPNTGDIHIQVAGADVWDDPSLFLLALHEVVEARLCFAHGVTQGAVDTFDANFTGEGEPGDHPDAPYRREHRAACMIEHSMALFLGIWDHGSVE